MFKLNSQGFAPILIIVIVGIIAAVGVTYSVQQSKKTSDQAITEKQKEELSDQSKDTRQQTGLENSNSQSYVYDPLKNKIKTLDPKQNAAAREPGFSFNPPTGWITYTPKSEWVKVSKANFRSPDEDRQYFGPDNKLYADRAAIIEILILPAGSKSLDSLISDSTGGIKRSGGSIITSRRLKEGDIETYFHEFKVPASSGKPEEQTLLKQYSVMNHHISYIILKDNYAFYFNASSAESAWSKRSAEISAAWDTFSFTPLKLPQYTIAKPDNWNSHPKADTTGKYAAEGYYPPDDNYYPHVTEIYLKIEYSPDTSLEIMRDSWNSQTSQFADRKITEVNKNNLPGYYYEYTVPNQSHFYRFFTYKDGYKINVWGKSVYSLWDKYADTIKKTVNSFNLTD